MKNPKITIITAVYNKEELIHTCINSVLNQSFIDFEYILVDDESPDNCPKICDDYALKDQRIKVIHRKNGGHALAVNSGVLEGKGDYFFILDADDYLVDDNCLLEMITIANTNDCDVVVSDFLNVWHSDNAPVKSIYSGIDFFTYLLSENIYHPTTRSRLWRKNILNAQNLFKNLICDDEEWTPKAFFRSKNVGIYSKSIYCRTTPEDSVTRIQTQLNYFKKANDKALTAGDVIMFFEKTNINDDQKRIIYNRFVSLYLSSLYIYANVLKDIDLKKSLLTQIKTNIFVLNYSIYYSNYKHNIINLINKFFGIKNVILFFKIFNK